MTISTELAVAVDGYEAVQPGHVAAGREMVMLRGRSAQPSRRAVLHVQASGDPAVSSELVSWFNERAFHFYLASVPLAGQAAARTAGQRAGPIVPRRLPGRTALTGSRAARRLRLAFAQLDAACVGLRESDGVDNIIVTAAGAAAPVVALWTDARLAAAADALILYEPALTARRTVRLNIGCPVLVLNPPDGGPRRRQLYRTRAVPIHFGSHVTWLQLRSADGRSFLGEGADVHEALGELGRWLGAYMYCQARDRLL